MIYIDTSFLVPLVLPESTSDSVTAFVGKLPVGELAVSHWTLVEFSSLVARKVRVGELDADGAARADARVEATVQGSFAVLLPSLGDFILARRFLGQFETGLRAPDALHLAIASNRDATAFYTLDNRLIGAGKILDLPVSAGIRAR